MNLFQNKYRTKSARLQTWDYRWAGAYFITICTNNRKHYFGKIENKKMVLSNMGVIADILWYEITNHSKNTELGAFVVMPNHIHGILILTNNEKNENLVEKGHALFLPNKNPIQPTEQSKTIGQQRFQNIGTNSVSSIIGSYKSAVTKNANRLGYEHAWQSLFYDHIIRNDDEYQRIVNYIKKNPENWEKDKYSKSNELETNLNTNNE